MIVPIPLQDLASKLPSLSGLPFTEKIQDTSFECTVSEPAGYVWPHVTVSNEEAHVVLIAAPGAMGKSAAARTLASALNSPLIDLSCLRVGSDSLMGLLGRVLGWSEAGRFITNLCSGTASLVLDSLDEAQLLAGRDNFIAFLNSIGSMMQDAAKSRQLIMFGRWDAVRTAADTFKDQGVEISLCSIEPLTYTQSCELINLSLDRHITGGNQYTVHRTHPQPFAKIRSRVFTEIAQALGSTASTAEQGWNETDYFLGYPPVLLALGRRLAIDNPSSINSVSNLIRDGHDSADRGELLRNIVEGILERESDKVRGRLGDAFGWPESDVRRRLLYSRDEQALRLLQHVAGAAFDLVPPVASEITFEERQRYEELISAFVPDHPLLSGNEIANVVFRDYIRALFSTFLTTEVYGVSRRELVAACEMPGPFYAHFVQALVTDRDGVVAIHDETIVNDLIKSHLASSTDEDAFAAYSHYDLGAYLGLFSRNKGRTNNVTFRITNPVAILELESPVSNLYITTTGAVSIESLGGEVNIGPSVSVVCAELNIEGERLNIISSDGEGTRIGSVVLASTSPADHSGRLKVTSYGKEFHAYWPDMWHQWKPYTMEETVEAALTRLDPHLSWQVLVSLRRILIAFEKSAAGVPTLYSEKLDRLVVGNNRTAASVLEALKNLGIVELASSSYRLKLERLSPFGVNYADLRGSNFPKILSKLHEAVFKENCVLRLVQKQELKPGNDAE